MNHLNRLLPGWRRLVNGPWVEYVHESGWLISMADEPGTEPMTWVIERGDDESIAGNFDLAGAFDAVAAQLLEAL